MPRVALKSVLGRRTNAAPMLAALAAAGGAFAIEDVEGRLLHGERVDDPAARFPVTLDGVREGWVSGSRQAEAVAAVLSHFLAREVEGRALGSEVLHLYREVNLIYAFSEKLTALLDVNAVARLTLEQARHLIEATDGAVMLLDEESRALETLAGFGDPRPFWTGVKCGEGVIGSVAANGTGEIVDDVGFDPRHMTDRTATGSLICAPLKVGDRVTGAIGLANRTPVAYTAGQLKLLTTLALQAASAIENARLFERTVEAARERERLLALHEKAEVARARLESELVLAARIQADLFPAALPPVDGYDLAARNRPARQCGGDYYDVLSSPSGDEEHRLLLCVADVSGKGLPASLLMANMQATLRALLGRTPSLRDLAGHANDLLYATTSLNKYVTASLFEFAPETGVGRYVSAGHTDCLLLKADGEAVWLKSTGTPLGLLPPGIPYEEATVGIDPGDCLVLFSDGVTEAQNDASEEFGETRLADVVRPVARSSAEQIVAHVIEAIDAFAAGAPQYDDITLLVLKRNTTSK